MSALTLEANVHVVDQETSDTKGLETNKKRKKARRKCADQMETQRFSTFSRKLSSGGRNSYQFDKSASAFDIYKQIINLDILIEILVQQSNLYLQ